ncbi:MAG: 4Fe-4S dicluster domain-containing protein [Flavobacteriaceae bacterium]
MSYIPNIIFISLLISSSGLFMRNLLKIKRNINLGKGETLEFNNPGKRLKNMLRVAFGQSKMVSRPVAGILHFIVYVSFVIINIELIEIIIDGIFGTHRVFSPIGSVYGILIGSFEILALLVIVSVSIFWIRRNILRIKRFFENKMMGWPKLDANLILYFEIILMFLFLMMNATDAPFQQMQIGNPISGIIYNNLLIDLENLYVFERIFWWSHIVGIFIFMNYLFYSKHLHIFLAFPNTYFAKMEEKGKLNNMNSVLNEVKLMIGSKDDESELNESSENTVFGASDVMDLSWLQLLNAYSCTECGRCTEACPANITGKKLSPRKIMMDTRDRIEEVGRNIDKNGSFKSDNKKLLGGYITDEELWACTSCNACVQECPIDIDPLSIIMDLRRYLVMENSSAPSELNNMMNNIENNGAPWPYSQMDRLNWKN